MSAAKDQSFKARNAPLHPLPATVRGGRNGDCNWPGCCCWRARPPPGSSRKQEFLEEEFALLTCQQSNKSVYSSGVLTIHMANIFNIGKQDGHQNIKALCKRMGHSLTTRRDNCVSFSFFILLLAHKMAVRQLLYTQHHKDSKYRKSETKFLLQWYAKGLSCF